ncbi:hypothetical protein HZ993_09310 [Rhodoferax sp. AJA081-3]|uniref:hypothetical protein n=1 Tax=Rhodoferax sp. AJA081-3 TaxID=2752316 RepID=UPI001AE0BCA1|nr:hypothetical protein [Rhodoferax sp. AJA081-3]QTN29978.1 hypothetical protein HZ993_09310 [Rhodoferax sp. AJA081-3]
MYLFDSISLAARNAFENANELPSSMLGNIVINEASNRAGLDSDQIGVWFCD